MKTKLQSPIKWITVLLALSSLAFNHPQKGEMVELTDWLSARSSARFRNIDQNRIKNLEPGTRGIVQKTKRFLKTGNYGICIDTDHKNSAPCVWVYFNKKNPNMRLVSVDSKAQAREEIIKNFQEKGVVTKDTKPTLEPEEADVAQTLTQVPAITDDNQETDDATAKTAIAGIDLLNQDAGKVLSPEPVCESCAPKLSSYPSCTTKNSYQESEIDQLLRSNKYANLYQSTQKQIIRTSCFQRSLESAPLGANYRQCDDGDIYPRKARTRTCASKDYVELTAKSFNAVANCMGDFVAGTKSGKTDASLMIFSLLAHESGLHNNAVSHSGAGGVGQMTSGAIKAVNYQLSAVMAHLKSSANPICSQTLAGVLSEPMSPYRAKLCDRLSLSKDNPLKNLIYSFALQGLERRYVEYTALNKVFSSVYSEELPVLEKERLLNSLAAWAHNTGVGGMQVPLRYLLSKYVRTGQKISDAGDVDQFLKDLAPVMKSFPHRLNQSAGRKQETSVFFSRINSRMAQITSEPKSCLAQ